MEITLTLTANETAALAEIIERARDRHGVSPVWTDKPLAALNAALDADGDGVPAYLPGPVLLETTDPSIPQLQGRHGMRRCLDCGASTPATQNDCTTCGESARHPEDIPALAGLGCDQCDLLNGHTIDCPHADHPYRCDECDNGCSPDDVVCPWCGADIPRSAAGSWQERVLAAVATDPDDGPPSLCYVDGTPLTEDDETCPTCGDDGAHAGNLVIIDPATGIATWTDPQSGKAHHVARSPHHPEGNADH